MEFEKETKNSIRYKEPDDVANKPVENLYMKKSAFQGMAPSEIHDAPATRRGPSPGIRASSDQAADRSGYRTTQVRGEVRCR